MERVPTTKTCRCGYASPTIVLRCLGCGRRLGRCERIVAAPAVAVAARRPTAPTGIGQRAVASPRPLVSRLPTPRRAAEPSAFSGRDLKRFAARSATPAPTLPASTFGPVAVLGLVAVAWIEPDAPRVEILTAAALLGAGLAAMRPATSSSSPDPVPARPTHLTDDELRDALAAW